MSPPALNARPAEIGQNPGKLGLHFPVEGVHRLRPVQGDDPQRAVRLDPDHGIGIHCGFSDLLANNR
jgi:hypothetical protein